MANSALTVLTPAELNEMFREAIHTPPMPGRFIIPEERWPHTVQYWGGIAHYIPPDHYVWRSWEDGPSDCVWIVPGTTP